MYFIAVAAVVAFIAAVVALFSAYAKRNLEKVSKDMRAKSVNVGLIQNRVFVLDDRIVNAGVVFCIATVAGIVFTLGAFFGL